MELQLFPAAAGTILGRYRFPKYPLFIYQAKTTDTGVTLTYWLQVIRLTHFEFDGLLHIGLLDRA